MKAKNVPDNVVFNPETMQYDAALKSYATSLGAPVITMTDTVAWKNRSISKVNQKVQTRYLQLKKEYDKMIEEFEYNNLTFSAQLNFEPIVGKVYHLYKRENDDMFLSLIAPEDCKFNSMGSFSLNADQIWEKV